MVGGAATGGVAGCAGVIAARAMAAVEPVGVGPGANSDEQSRWFEVGDLIVHPVSPEPLLMKDRIKARTYRYHDFFCANTQSMTFALETRRSGCLAMVENSFLHLSHCTPCSPDRIIIKTSYSII